MSEADLQRRFGGMGRLYGEPAAHAIRGAHAVVIGIGGVGSWAVEALARSGVGRLTLIDMDHVSESNINRQIHALGSTLGMSKIEAMRQRVLDIHPDCQVQLIDDFVTPDNAHALLAAACTGLGPADVVLDACDQVRAKVALAAWSVALRCPLIAVGAAGGKRLAQAVEVADLSAVTHDRLLAQVRHDLRKHHLAPRQGALGIACVYSREPVTRPLAACTTEDSASTDASLNCHGYGSAVTVTATFGLVAAGLAIDLLSKNAHQAQGEPETEKNDAII